jgi:hypothetical protein
VTQRGKPRSNTQRDDDPDDDRPSLSVEDAVRSTLDDAAALSSAHVALVATALTLARKLDDGAGMATAAVARELRSTLDAILKGAETDDDDALTGFLAGLSTPMVDRPFT